MSDLWVRVIAELTRADPLRLPLSGRIGHSVSIPVHVDNDPRTPSSSKSILATLQYSHVDENLQ